MGELSVLQNSVNPTNLLHNLFAKTVSAPSKYYDSNQTGLHLRVDAIGAKFSVQYIMLNDKRCELGLGNLPVITLAVALENKRVAIGERDPLKAKKMECASHLLKTQLTKSTS
jgi:hypothetical protein